MNKQNTKQNKIKIAEIKFTGQTRLYIWMYHGRTAGLQAIRICTQRILGAGFNHLKAGGYFMYRTARFNIQKVYFLCPKLTCFVSITEETAIISLKDIN